MRKDKFMNIDAETKLFIQNRFNSNAKLHHTLSPDQLRKERINQLKIDNLISPEIFQTKNLEILSKDNKSIH